MRGGADKPAVQCVRTDNPVDHLDRGHTTSSTSAPSWAIPVYRSAIHEPTATSRPTATCSSSRAALEIREHLSEDPSEPVVEPLIHLVRVGAADVVRLEDPQIGHKLHLRWRRADGGLSSGRPVAIVVATGEPYCVRRSASGRGSAGFGGPPFDRGDRRCRRAAGPGGCLRSSSLSCWCSMADRTASRMIG
jgi:hypothetical protein